MLFSFQGSNQRVTRLEVLLSLKLWSSFLHSYNIAEFEGFGKRLLHFEMFQCVTLCLHSYNIAQPGLQCKLLLHTEIMILSMICVPLCVMIVVCVT